MTKLEVGKEYWIKGKLLDYDITAIPYKFMFKGNNMASWISDEAEVVEVVPEREKVTIDRHMDVYITVAKENGLTLQQGLSDFKPKNSEIFARAWLDGYTVEEPLGVLLVDIPGNSYWKYTYLVEHSSGGVYAAGSFSIKVVLRNAYKVTEAEAKEKYPNFKWVSLEELDNEN